MAVPDFQALMRPVLAAAADKPRKMSEVVEELADQFNLTQEERNEPLASGQTRIFNRAHWARTYLKQAALIIYGKRGWYELTDRGRGVLADPNIKINIKHLEIYPEFQDFRSRTKDKTEQLSSAEDDIDTGEVATTPDENLEQAHRRLDDALAATLLDYIQAASPTFFEHLIVDLLISMGYGGSSENPGRALGQAGDDGVDGVIDQDSLGVDQIYLQAKRYRTGNNIAPSHIRDFYGALNLKKAHKGIFVTTSDFTPSARQTAKDLGQRIVLIDGQQLVRLMIKFNVGCRDRAVLHIREVDEAYFEEAGLAV